MKIYLFINDIKDTDLSVTGKIIDYLLSYDVEVLVDDFFYKKLDENRNKKNCKYAVLVSNLEMDKPNSLPIFKVREYEKDIVMYDGTEIPIDDIIAIEGNQFNETESI